MSHFNQTIKKQNYELQKSVFEINVTPLFNEIFFHFIHPIKNNLFIRKQFENY